MAITENKNKVSSLAKDFGMQSKDIIAILKDYTEAPKGHSQVLSDRELSIVFDYLTLHHQVKIETIFAETYTEKKEEPKAAPAPAASAPKAAPAPAANTQPDAAKTAAPQAAAPKAAPAAGQAAPGKSTATQQPTTRVPEKKIVDTRKSTNVNLDKYDEKLQDMAERSSAGGGRRDNLSAGKEKFRSAANKKNGRGAPTFSNKRRQEEAEKMRRLQLEIAKKTPLTVKIPDEISVGELASRMKKTGAEVVKCLMKNGVMASLSQMIDFDTASFVAEELGCKVEKEVVVTIEEKLIDDHEDTADELKPRAPVVVVMGHVDHGKTSLLDYIRNAHVASGEAGGITQHIGAYQVQIKGKPITFLDTPGHEAFTSMRARGAMITDIAILVVAAEDGIKPQTVESINHAKAAGIPIIVAINKMDKPDANPERIKEQLTKYDLLAEDWGGDTIVCPISAKTGMGVDNLLEMVALTAEVGELKANPNRAASGAVIEARLDKGRGPIATLLVQNGTLHQGDIIIAGTAVGRVRMMTNDKGQKLTSAVSVRSRGDHGPRRGAGRGRELQRRRRRALGARAGRAAQGRGKGQGERAHLQGLAGGSLQPDSGGRDEEPEHHCQGGRAGQRRGGQGLAGEDLQRRGPRARHPWRGRRDQRERRHARFHLERHHRRLQRPSRRSGPRQRGPRPRRYADVPRHLRRHQ